MIERDTELLEAAQAGDQAALGRLLERHAAAVTRFSRRMCRHPEDAEDVLQETLAAAARSLGDFRGEASLSTWLFTVARSFCIKQRRAGKHAPERIVSLDDGPASSVAAPASAPDEIAESREALRALDQALAELPPDRREVLLLRDVEGLPASDAARILGIGVAALKSRLHRARAELREKMAPFLTPGAESPSPSCPEIASIFSRYLEGDIAQDECARMEAHIATCRSCGAACDALKTSLSLCRASAEREVPLEIQAMVRRAIGNLGATEGPGAPAS